MLSLVVYAVHVPMLIGFTVARYYAPDFRPRPPPRPPTAHRRPQARTHDVAPVPHLEHDHRDSHRHRRRKL